MFSPEARIQLVSVWQALNFALNGIVFLLIGLAAAVCAGGHSRVCARHACC